MQYVYALTNFLLLTAIVLLFGRKKIASIFRNRAEALGRALDEAEQTPSQETLLIAEPGIPGAQAQALFAATQAVEEARQRAEQRYAEEFARDCKEMQRATFNDVRDEFVKAVQDRARKRVTESAWQDRLRMREVEMVERVLSMVTLTPGDHVYLIKSEALYVTLTSTEEMDPALVARIGAHMERLLEEVGRKPSFRVRCDESLLGGFQLRVGDTIYDCSAANRIDRIGRSLSKSRVDTEDAASMLAALMDAVCKEPTDVDVYQVGRVISVSDGICWLDGLSDIVFGGVVEFECGERGMVLDVSRDRIACIIYGRFEHIESYSRVRRMGVMASVPVGEELLGRVVDPLGNPIDGLGRIWATQRRPIEHRAPAIPDRKSVATPLQTGIKVIDALVPIGQGQRELIIGDRQTGKTAIAVDAIINQKGKNIPCIYVAICQKEATVAGIVAKLEQHGAMEYTTIVCATASDSASLQYVAPFAGAAMGEYFMYAGKHALIIYDDLSKHAVAYRELSLLLHRPSGREAYPGDIFYLHARLLERAAQLSDEAGGGSLTALPIIETQAGDISAYIPTNVISITDGQIFLETELFNEGQRPAINVGLSVSRVGGAAQTKLMKQVSAHLRMELAQYRELVNFAQFGTDLDGSTKSILAAGARMMAALRQGRYAPLDSWKQALVIFAVAQGYAKNTAPEQMEAFEEMLYLGFKKKFPQLVAQLQTGKRLDAAAIDRLKAALASLVPMEEA